MKLIFMVALLMTAWFMQPTQFVQSEGIVMNRYPVASHGSGEGGSFQIDMTMQEPTEVTLLFSADGSFVWVDKTVSVFLSQVDDIPEMIQLEHIDEGEYLYTRGDPDDAGYITLRLTMDDDMFHGSEHIMYVLGDQGYTFILAPLDSSDPRPDDGERCGNGARIRLRIGDTAATSMASGEVILHDYLYPGVTIPAYVNTVEVIAGPRCKGEIAWWQVHLSDDPDSVAWTPEMTLDGAYVLNPVRSHDVFEFSCAGFPSRLSIGAYVIPSFYQLHNTTDRSGVHFAVDPRDGRYYRISDGPECIDGVIWWYVQLGANAGWVYENENHTYRLHPSRVEPLSDRLQAMINNG